MLRPDWKTVIRRMGMRPVALALWGGFCPECEEEVFENEPIMLIGSTVVREPDGRKVVDLSGAEWICQRQHAVT